nr:hypothetical protein [Tanacetum cinerariifolium]
MPPRKRACLTTLGFDIGESSVAGAAWQQGPTESDLRRCRVEQEGYGITDTQDKIVDKMMEITPTTLEGVNERVTEWTSLLDRGRMSLRDTGCGIDYPDNITTDPVDYGTWTYRAIIKMAPKKRTSIVTPAATTTPTTTVTNAQLKALIDRGVAAALAERDVDRNRNGDNSNDSGTGGRRQTTSPRECSYTDFLKCQPMNFQGTEGVVGLARWAKKMESVFQIRNCTVACQVKFPSYTLQGSALTWWNSHMRAVGQDVERYIGGLPDMIHGSVKASKPQSIQEAIEFATEMMDKKMLTHAERQAEHKRKLDDTSRNNQHQQQPFKRNNVARAYTAGPGDKKPYGGIKPLCPKCNYHHVGPCT